MGWKFGIGEHVLVSGVLSVVVSRQSGEYKLKTCGANSYSYNMRAKSMEEVAKIKFIYTGENTSNLVYGCKYTGYMRTGNCHIYMEDGTSFRYEHAMSPKQFEALQNVEFVCVKEPVETRELNRPVFIGRKCHLVPTDNQEPFLLLRDLRDGEPYVSAYLSEPLVEFDEYFDINDGYNYLHDGGRLDSDMSFWVDGRILEMITGHHILCPTCGKFVRYEDLKLVDKSLVCPYCADDTVTNWITGELMPRRVAKKIQTHEGTQYVYWDEWEDVIMYPDDDPYFAYKEGVMEVDGKLLTEAYVNKQLASGDFIRCSRCGRVCSYINAMQTETGEYICENCLNDCIGKYHSSPITTFTDTDKKSMILFGDEPFFGVEHELAFVGSRNNRLAYKLMHKFNRHCERDSSIPNGFEVISQPMTFDRWKKENMTAYMALLKENNYGDSEATGIHVHMSTQNLDKHAVAEICKFVYENYDELIKFGRRNPHVTDYFKCVNIINETLDDEVTIATNNASRYHAVNTRHLYGNHIELRFFASTGDESHFWSILEFCYCLEKSAEEGGVNWETITRIAEEDGRCENFLKEVDDKFNNRWTAKYNYHV